MNRKQVDILIKFHKKLLDSLTPEQADAWYDICEKATDGDIADDIIELIEFIRWCSYTETIIY